MNVGKCDKSRFFTALSYNKVSLTLTMVPALPGIDPLKNKRFFSTSILKTGSPL